VRKCILLKWLFEIRMRVHFSASTHIGVAESAKDQFTDAAETLI